MIGILIYIMKRLIAYDIDLKNLMHTDIFFFNETQESKTYECNM